MPDPIRTTVSHRVDRCYNDLQLLLGAEGRCIDIVYCIDIVTAAREADSQLCHRTGSLCRNGLPECTTSPFYIYQVRLQTPSARFRQALIAEFNNND
jgi:hypothetical protein